MFSTNLEPCLFGLTVPQVSLTRSPPMRNADNQGEVLLLNSYDRTLVIKQISSEDVADMHNILSEYHQVTLPTVGRSSARCDVPSVEQVFSYKGTFHTVSELTGFMVHKYQVHIWVWSHGVVLVKSFVLYQFDSSVSGVHLPGVCLHVHKIWNMANMVLEVCSELSLLSVTVQQFSTQV